MPRKPTKAARQTLPEGSGQGVANKSALAPFCTIARTGHHLLMERYEIKEGFSVWQGGVEPLDAPEFIPAGASYMVGGSKDVPMFPATLTVFR
jgi:hypothetical protein